MRVPRPGSRSRRIAADWTELPSVGLSDPPPTTTISSGGTWRAGMMIGSSLSCAIAAAGSASALGNYTSQIACSNANAGSPTVLPNGAGISFDLANLAPADDITCTYSNGRTIADLTITKSNTFTQAQPSDLPDDVVATGAATTYTLAVTNQGPAVVTGAVVRDAPGAGITCPGGNTVTITGNGVPPGSFTINDLIAGIALGQLAAGETARLSFTCTVN